MKNETENALTFMNHHHKMYSHLFPHGYPESQEDPGFPRYLYALGIEAKVPWLIEGLSACPCCDDRDRDRDRGQVKRPTSLINLTSRKDDTAKTKTKTKTKTISIDPFIRPWPPIPEPKVQVTPEVVDDCPCPCPCRRYVRHLYQSY